jgi:hypothetical protein
MGRHADGGVRGALDELCRGDGLDGAPQGGGGMEHIEVDLAPFAQGGEDFEFERIGGGEPVDGQSVGEVDPGGPAADGFEAGGQQLGQRRHPDPVP